MKRTTTTLSSSRSCDSCLLPRALFLFFFFFIFSFFFLFSLPSWKPKTNAQQQQQGHTERAKTNKGMREQGIIKDSTNNMKKKKEKIRGHTHRLRQQWCGDDYIAFLMNLDPWASSGFLSLQCTFLKSSQISVSTWSREASMSLDSVTGLNAMGMLA